jgi:hypothetical protein
LCVKYQFASVIVARTSNMINYYFLRYSQDYSNIFKYLNLFGSRFLIKLLNHLNPKKDSQGQLISTSKILKGQLIFGDSWITYKDSQGL